MFVTIFLDIHENTMRKNLINPSCPKHPKIEIKNDIIMFTIICSASERLILF